MRGASASKATETAHNACFRADVKPRKARRFESSISRFRMATCVCANLNATKWREKCRGYSSKNRGNQSSIAGCGVAIKLRYYTGMATDRSIQSTRTLSLYLLLDFSMGDSTPLNSNSGSALSGRLAEFP